MTVKELIKKLQTMPQDNFVRVYVAAEGYDCDVVEIIYDSNPDNGDPTVYLETPSI